MSKEGDDYLRAARTLFSSMEFSGYQSEFAWLFEDAERCIGFLGPDHPFSLIRQGDVENLRLAFLNGDDIVLPPEDDLQS